MPEADLKELLRVDAAGLLAEALHIEEHFAEFGEKLPGGLREELAAFVERLKAAG